MKKLLQDLCDFKRYKYCLNKELHKIYKSYLIEKVLNEITSKGLASTFRRFLRQNELDDPEATLFVINKFKKAALNTQYLRLYGKVVKDGRTNLETNAGEFCDKETFIREFEKLNFDDLKSKEDLSVYSTVKTFLDTYLEIYDEDGWLVLSDYNELLK